MEFYHFLASRWVQKSRCFIYRREGPQSSIYDTLSSRVYACTMENHPWWRVYWSIHSWCCHNLFRWAPETVLSSNIKLFCRLPRKVSFLIFGGFALRWYVTGSSSLASETWELIHALAALSLYLKRTSSGWPQIAKNDMIMLAQTTLPIEPKYLKLGISSTGRTMQWIAPR